MKISVQTWLLPVLVVLVVLAGCSGSSGNVGAGGGPLYPNYNTNPLPADASGMNSTAADIADRITLGWNAGNSLEATGGETNWGNPSLSEALIQLVKANGFDAVRIPASWDQYADPDTAMISESWLNRVKEVVEYCVVNDMFVIVNIHWDGGWLENNVTTDMQARNNAKQKAYWEQIATHLREFDEHLIFASANEPNVDTAAQMAVLLSYHQTFVDAVRSTGGRNAYRVLAVQGPRTDIELTNELWTEMPADSVSDRLMMEVHFYTPWNFTGLMQDESWGKQFFYWGEEFHSSSDTERNPTWGEEDQVDRLLASMKARFVDQGIPVVIGEFGAARRNNLVGDDLALHKASRAHYLKYVTEQSIANRLLPFYWDNGGLDHSGSGIFDRFNLVVSDQAILDALNEGAAK